MSLRPRYSLLTLLLLTAAVAGGIKLWRGPYRVVIGSKPSELDQLALSMNSPEPSSYVDPMLLPSEQAKHEYEFQRDIGGTSILWIKGWYPHASLQFFRSMQTTHAANLPISVYGESVIRETIENRPELMLAAGDRLVCWIAGDVKADAEKALHAFAKINNDLPVVSSRFHEVIYLSEHGSLYRKIPPRPFDNLSHPKVLRTLIVEPIALEAILDPALRNRVAEEQQKLQVSSLNE